MLQARTNAHYLPRPDRGAGIFRGPQKAQPRKFHAKRQRKRSSASLNVLPCLCALRALREVFFLLAPITPGGRNLLSFVHTKEPPWLESVSSAQSADKCSNVAIIIGGPCAYCSVFSNFLDAVSARKRLARNHACARSVCLYYTVSGRGNRYPRWSGCSLPSWKCIAGAVLTTEARHMCLITDHDPAVMASMKKPASNVGYRAAARADTPP